MATNIKIGLVNIPTILVNTINNYMTKIERHKIHIVKGKKCGRVGYKNYCKECDKELKVEEVATEYKGKVLTDEQIDNIKRFLENQSIEILAFKKLDISKKKDFLRATYYLLPDISKDGKAGNQKNFYGLFEALKELDLTGIALYTSRGNQQLGLMYFEDGRAKLSLMAFNEAVNNDILRLEENLPKFEKKELPIEQAKQFITQNINDKFDILKVKNNLRDRYDKAVEGKLKLVEQEVEINVFETAIKNKVKL